MAETPKRHRSFGARKNIDRTPITFDLLDGKYSFEVRPAMQGAVILDFVAAADESANSSAAHLLEFIDKALKDDEERARFEAVIRSDDVDDVIDIAELGDIVSWLVEEYTARPTQGSSQSSATS